MYENNIKNYVRGNESILLKVSYTICEIVYYFRYYVKDMYFKP